MAANRALVCMSPFSVLLHYFHCGLFSNLNELALLPSTSSPFSENSLNAIGLLMTQFTLFSFTSHTTFSLKMSKLLQLIIIYPQCLIKHHLYQKISLQKQKLLYKLQMVQHILKKFTPLFLSPTLQEGISVLGIVCLITLE